MCHLVTRYASVFGRLKTSIGVDLKISLKYLQVEVIEEQEVEQMQQNATQVPKK